MAKSMSMIPSKAKRDELKARRDPEGVSEYR